MNYYQGKYKLKHPEKYIGNPDLIIYRSSYELKFMNFLDNHPSVLKWGSEELIIPYIWNGERHRYFPDFAIEYKCVDGTIKKMIVEIKPHSQTQPPKAPKRKTAKTLERYENDIATFTKNMAKWEAAKRFCDNNNATFTVLTENELFKKSSWAKK